MDLEPKIFPEIFPSGSANRSVETHEGPDETESLRFANNIYRERNAYLSSLEDSASQNLERKIVLTVVNEFNVLKYMSDK